MRENHHLELDNTIEEETNGAFELYGLKKRMAALRMQRAPGWIRALERDKRRHNGRYVCQ
jgi:hypothetical protein